MRTSGQLLGSVLAKLQKIAEPGMTTQDLDEIARRQLQGTGGTPAFLGYQGFTGAICASVNDEVVHGVPSPDRVLESGDILGIDFGVTYDGMITDSAITLIVGQPRSTRHKTLLEDTDASLHAGLRVLKDGVHVGDIGHAVESVLKPGGYGIVRDLVGHGVGHDLHEEPNIPNYGKKGTGPTLAAGMTVAIEPMATLGDHRVFVEADGWTIKTRDGSLSAHFEHTVLITENGYEILTLR